MTDIDAMATRFAEMYMAKLEERGQCIVAKADIERLEAEAQALREEVAALRARVAVVPDASTVYAALDARERLFTSPENIQVALEAQSRLNGKAVSEGLLRRLARPAHRYDEVFTVDRHDAAEELRALLGEGKEHE
ncbi:hypothetical protein NDR77_33105 [Pseudomonas aeruginosa]|nr:hypothetical protein [Pseudomonas aeruginosa]HBN7643480.1 hypothetical protein [Pseudomonas aeruginosa]HBN7784143.1 hypothetical protein [Pseudomonas aeruginosa]HBN7805061.1 hypothetical protein [Pseudomonas aeruginosa]HBN7839271.1 hypothetical protein [Pseudomonas aeruginosa]